jgi:hypothetical protein
LERKRGCSNAPDPLGGLSALLMTGNLSNRNGSDIFCGSTCIEPFPGIPRAFTPLQNGKPTSIAQMG